MARKAGKRTAGGCESHTHKKKTGLNWEPLLQQPTSVYRGGERRARACKTGAQVRVSHKRNPNPNPNARARGSGSEMGDGDSKPQPQPQPQHSGPGLGLGNGGWGLETPTPTPTRASILGMALGKCGGGGEGRGRGKGRGGKNGQAGQALEPETPTPTPTPDCRYPVRPTRNGATQPPGGEKNRRSPASPIRGGRDQSGPIRGRLNRFWNLGGGALRAPNPKWALPPNGGGYLPTGAQVTSPRSQGGNRRGNRGHTPLRVILYIFLSKT